MIIMLDTNIILDIFQKREPFFNDSYQALRQAIESESECLISATAATDIFYILRKHLHSADKARNYIEQLSQFAFFADVQAADIFTALKSALPDFEDAVMDAAAERHGAACILTRNIGDFTDSMIPAITPTAFMAEVRKTL